MDNNHVAPEGWSAVPLGVAGEGEVAVGREHVGMVLGIVAGAEALVVVLVTGHYSVSPV